MNSGVHERRCKLSVVVATRNRAEQLERMLASVAQQTADLESVQVIVVENGSTDHTLEVLAGKAGVLNLLALSEGAASKSKALNRALDQVSGDLVVFADDDITAPPNWLEAYQSAALKFSSASVFCGPVIPEFPGMTPQWLRCHPIGAPLFFAKFDPRLPEGPIPGPLTESDFPVGANFAVRAKALKTLRFITDLGPSKENGPLYDEDTEFLARLHSEFGEFIFVPGAYVAHHIDARRIEWPELFEKAFHYGRTVAIRSGLPVPPMQLLKPPSSEPDAASIERFEKGCTLNFLCGQMHEFRLQGQRHFEAELKSMLVPLDVRANRSLLSRSALISSTHPEFAVAGNTPDVTSGTIQ